MRNKAILIFFLVFFISLIVNAEDLDLSKIFTEHNVEGTILISSLDGKTTYLYNKERAEKRFLPASTFKIPNTLIALKEGVISNENEIIKWDGKFRWVASWNKDHSLKTAFPVSCVWFYQELAKRIGIIKYLYYLKKLNYGNKMTGSDLTTFWLNGDIRISVTEQVQFLKKLYKGKLPFKKNHLQLLKKIMIVENKPEYIIRAKTGWAVRIKEQYGWYVGYVEKKEQVWFFATNIKIKNKKDAAFRKIVTMKALKLKGII